MIHSKNSSTQSKLLVAGGFFLSEEEKASSRARLRKGGCLPRLAGGVDGRREKGKKIEGCKDVKLLGKDTN